MAGSLTSTELTAVNVGGDLHAENILRVVQNITNIIKPEDPPPKNIRFKVEKPIQTFIGRETFLVELHRVVKEGQNGKEGGVTVLTQDPLSVVAATGGIGKTETVRMYIQLHENEYDHIIWIDANEASFVKGQFDQLAMRLKISTDFDGKPKEFDLILTEIFEKLLQHAHVVLLVFDNAEALEDDEKLNLSGIRLLRPKSLSPFFVEPTIIVTSRNQNWSLQKVIHLDLWTEAEVVIFVIRRLELVNNSENTALALQLGSLFGRLPIALQSAVAVILQQTKRRKKYGIQILIDEYESGSRKVLAQKPLDANMRPTRMSDTMLVLWNISLEKIVRFEDEELAIKILCFMAYMSPTRIPQDFLFALFINSFTVDCFDNALEILKDYSLIASFSSEDDSDYRSFSIHRMIQDSTIENLKNRTYKGQTPHPVFKENTFLNEAELLLKLSAESMNFIQTFGALTISSYGELVENLVQITSHVSKQLHVEEFRGLTEMVATILWRSNNFKKSSQLYERALKATHLSNVDSEILKIIQLKRNFALAYDGDGQTQKSKELWSEVLKDETRALGPHHTETLDTKGSMATALYEQGKFKEALAMYREVLHDFQNGGDTQTKSYLLTKSNYASALCDQGDSEEALTLLNEVLKEQEKNPDWNSMTIINTKSHIASALEAQGNLKEATVMMEQIIEDAPFVFGLLDMYALSYRGSYATLLSKQGNHDQATRILLELIEIQKNQFGPEHTSTLDTKGRLAKIYVDTKEFDQAIPLFEVEVRRFVREFLAHSIQVQ